MRLYIKYPTFATDEGMSALIKDIQGKYNLPLNPVGMGSQWPSLESLERLWNGYQSGDISDIAERYLVTRDGKKKVNVKNVTLLKTTIEEENYRLCKKIVSEKSCAI